MNFVPNPSMIITQKFYIFFIKFIEKSGDWDLNIKMPTLLKDLTFKDSITLMTVVDICMR